MSIVIRPTADRALTPGQLELFAAIAQGRDLPILRGQGSTPRRDWTLAALAAKGLIAYLPDRGWCLTHPAGYALAEELGLIERPDPTEGSPGDLADPPAEAGCVTCPAPREAWDTDHDLYQPGGSQCPLCVEADIAEDHKATRREDH